MNKLYKTLDIYSAWLIEVDSQYNSFSGIKNIIGIKVIHNGEHLFYSILDDCFFRILSQTDLTIDTCKDFHGRLFVQIDEYQKSTQEIKTFGLKLHDYINKDYVTKQEIMEIKKDQEWLFGYQSDFSYELLKTDTTVDYENPLMIDENIIDTVQKYEEKEKRPITYDSTHIYGPNKLKKLNVKVKSCRTSSFKIPD